MKRWVAVAVAPLLVVACAFGTASPTPAPSSSPGPTTGPQPSPAGHDLSVAELKYRLLDAFAPLTYCDPDVYPIGRGDEGQKAAERFHEIQADASTFAAILARLGLTGSVGFTADQKLAIYREWKQLNAIFVTPTASGALAFDLVTETDPGMGQGTRSKGTIDQRGAIAVTSSEAAFLVGCPICLARGTLIATPRGPVAVDAMRVGGPVWTLDSLGHRVPGVVVEVSRAAVPASHEVVHLVLDDGREVWASLGHPLANGRRLGDLRLGDLVDGGLVVSAALVGYGSPFTFDLLPSGPTGLYWAGGILLGSTLHR